MKIAIITGSRADRGPLEVVFQALDDYGIGNGQPNRPLFPRWIDVEKVAESWGKCPSPFHIHVTAQCATWTSGDLLSKPTDLVIVHGDRYEILGAVIGANMMGVPIAHIAGGDVTEGSADDSYRHAITKLSHLHFPNCAESAARIIQMGEDPERVHMVGDPAIDRILQTPLLGKDETFRAVGLLAVQRALLVSLHPETLGDTGATLNALLGALKALDGAIGIVLIGPNADLGHQTIELAWQPLASARPNTVYCPDLPANVFLSLLKHCDVMAGNSSAALYEAPAFGLPAVNIGDRQHGRSKHFLVRDCYPDKTSISIAIKWAIAEGRTRISPEKFGDGHAAERIANVIGGIKDPKSLLRKRFQTIDMGRYSSPEEMGNVP